MKTAKTTPLEGSSSSNRRSQPVRLTRTNPPRSTSLNRTSAQTGASGNGHGKPIDIFPAVTHFADAITALPKDLVRHFTLLKEVDAKVFAPEESLFKLIDATLKSSPSEATRWQVDGSASHAPSSAPMSMQNSNTGSVPMPHHLAPPSVDGSFNPTFFDPADLSHRQLFRHTAFKIQEMLVSLEEKNHVISTANEALQKHLARIEDLWPHLEAEFSDEAKWGSTTHWAYLENRVAKANNNTQAERSRREGAATLSAAAQQLAEEAAARSSDRKQALAAKKNSKSQAADADDEGRQQELTKKTQGSNKPRKPTTDAQGTVGLGISAASPANGGPPSKRRKVESKANANGGGTERAMSTVFGSNASKAKPASPRQTPAPDGSTKKRKALPSGSAQSKKSRTGATVSPSVASSPVLSNLPDTFKPGRSSPGPSNATRPTPSRARQNSIQSNAESGRQRPSSSASNKPNGALTGTGAPDVPLPAAAGRVSNDTKTLKEPPATAKPDPVKVESEPQVTATPSISAGAKKDSAATKTTEEKEARKDPAAAVIPPPITTPSVTTKSGRASKPSTPALATFAEAARSRPARGTSEGTSNPVKRSHKKGASAAAAAMAAMAQQQAVATDGDRGAGDEEEEADPDGDEPRYCYCNNVSYGEMVACDADGCKREWFHLECVGLKVAPKGNAKWYCEDCKRRLRLGGKTVNGR